MKNKQIVELNNVLASLQGQVYDTKAQLQSEFNKVFDKMPELQAAISQVQDSQEYSFDSLGEVVSWLRFDFSPFSDCLDYLQGYLSETHCIYTDLNNDCLTYSQGESIVVQDDAGRDNGVYLADKCIINESEYKNDGEVDETKRNALIEAYMEKTGYFPGVFRCDRGGRVYSVKTLKS
jgi:hypothetical protein